MSKFSLTKEGLKGFSISYNKAKTLGITDEDLKYIYEIGPDKFRISMRYVDVEGKKQRFTKVVQGLLNAINVKWEFLNSLKQSKENIENSQSNVKKEVEKEDSEEENEFQDLTLRDGFDKFFIYRQSLIGKKTGKKIERTTYEKDIIIYQGRHIRDCDLLDKRIVDITAEDAQLYVDELFVSKPVKENGNETLSENTINNPYELMHKAFEYFKNKLKIIRDNPFDEVEQKPKYKPKDRNYLASTDIHYVLDEIDKKNIRFRLLINLFLETGLRIEEILAIKYSDINRRRSTIKIVRALVKSRLTGELIIKDLKTDASEREITISEYTLNLIDNHRHFKEQCGVLITNDDFIFTSWLDNELITPSRYTAEWRIFIRLLGYSELPLRVLRHSAATFMLQGETNIEAVKKRFGWSKVSTVLGIYNQSNLEEDRKLLNKFEEEFRNSLGLTYAELYCISVNRLNNKRKVNSLIQKLLSKPVEDIDYTNDLKQCQDYLFDLFPVFRKIAVIDTQLDDEEVNAIFEGFKQIYKRIKIEPLSKVT